MKKITIIILLMLLRCVVSAQLTQQTNIIYGNIGDYGLHPVQQVAITLTLVQPNPRTVNNILIRQDPISTFTDTKGKLLVDT